jgi:hypothetical protein
MIQGLRSILCHCVLLDSLMRRKTRFLCDSVAGRGPHFHQALDLRRFVGVNFPARLVGVKECG